MSTTGSPHFMKSTLVYTVAGLLGPLVALLLTPLYTRALGVAGYGTVDLVQTLAHVAYTAALWGIPTTLASRYLPDDVPHARDLITNALVVGIVGALVLSALLSITAPWLARYGQRPALTQYIHIQMLSLPFGVLHGIVLAWLRLHGDTVRSVVVVVSVVVVTALTRVVLVLWLRWGEMGMIVAASLTNIINALFIVWLARAWLGGRLHWPLMVDVFRLGAPLVPASLAIWVLLYQDRWLLAGRVDAVQQGEYALAVLLVSLLALVIEPVKQAWQPLALRQPIEERARFWEMSLRHYWGLALLAGAVVTLWSRELLWLMSGHASTHISLWVAVLVVMPISGGLVTIISMVVVIHAQPRITAWSTLVAAVVNTVLNLLLIPYWGVTGAVIATALAALLIPGLIWWWGRALEQVAYAWWRLLGITSWYLVLMGWGVWAAPDWWARLGVIALLGCGLWLGKIWRWEEVRTWFSID
jgi:O-antigen/teichoic acid export membrane protein